MEQNFYKSLPDKVYRRLLADIISGKIPPGEKLKEDALSLRMKVSRTPIREAIHRLTQEGLIERIPRCGCFVKKNNNEDVRDFFECRMLLECHALNTGFDNIPQKKIKMMQELLQNIEKLEISDQTEASLKVDDLMHDLIAEICPNKLVRSMLMRLQQQCRPFRTFRSLDKKEIFSATAERSSIIKAIAGGNRNEAVRLLKKHIMGAKGTAYR